MIVCIHFMGISDLLLYMYVIKCEVSIISQGYNSISHFRKNDLMPVIICKNDKHLVTVHVLVTSFIQY